MLVHCSKQKKIMWVNLVYTLTLTHNLNLKGNAWCQKTNMERSDFCICNKSKWHMQQKLLGSKHDKIQLDHCYTAEGTYTIKMKIYSACSLFFLKKKQTNWRLWQIWFVHCNLCHSTFITEILLKCWMDQVILDCNYLIYGRYDLLWQFSKPNTAKEVDLF